MATVDQQGTVKAVGAGETKIIAAYAGKSVECLVSVSSPVTSVVPDKSTLLIEKGESEVVTVTIGPEDINVNYHITWTASDEAIFTVTPDAENPAQATVKGLRGGEATLFVQAGDVTTSIPVTINVELKGLVISGFNGEPMYKGDQLQLSVSKDPEDALGELDPVWSSSDEAVLTVDQTGLVRALAPGTATVKVASNGFEQTVEITVKVLATVTVSVSSSSNPLVSGDVTLSWAGNINYSSWYGLETYNGGTITFTVTDGMRISEISFSSSYGSGTFTADSGNLECTSSGSGWSARGQYKWTGDAQSVTITNAAGTEVDLKDFTITYKG